MSSGREPLRRVHVFIEGRVQGVWFRDSARHEAEVLGVTGWVRNLPDGRVEAVYEGARDAVAHLIAWSWQGPDQAHVTNLEEREEAPLGERGFRIR